MSGDFYSNLILRDDLPLPLYFQIQENIKRCVESGQLVPGDKLPSEREIAEKLNINRLTVRQAMNELVNEGLLTRRRGLGTFVARPKVEQGLAQLASFTEDMARRGFRPAIQLLSLEIQPADKRVSQALQLDLGECVIVIERLRLADDEPMALEVSHLPNSRFPDFFTYRSEVAQSSLYGILRSRYNVELVRARETLEARTAGNREADLLGIGSGTAVLARERTTYDQRDLPVEFVKSLYRADRYKFMIEVVK